MTSPTKLLITDQDYERLALLVLHSETNSSAALEEELGRAQVVSQKEIPSDVVTMNSRIKFIDDETKKETEITLVYPKDADVTKGQVSILAPVGIALIGLRVGQTIDWPMPTGIFRKLKVTGIAYQPEASGNWEL